MTIDIVGPKIKEDTFLKQVEEYQSIFYIPRCECGTITQRYYSQYECPDCGKSYLNRLNYSRIYDFKLIVAGSRTIGQGFYSSIESERNQAVLVISDIMIHIQAFLSQEDINWWDVEVVSGRAKGPDTFGEWWALSHGSSIKFFPADWKLGPKAGFIRNEQMGDYADALIAFWDGKSGGTKHMIEYMMKLGKPIRVHFINE